MIALDGPPILFVDLDGTVRHGRDELGRFVNTPDDVVVFPEAVERMRAWRAAGGIVLGVTNQGGIALGYITHADHSRCSVVTIERCDGQLDNIIVCPHHPDGGCWCRKPRPGLIFAGLHWAGLNFGTPERSACLMVGDRPEDEQAAAAAGVRFQWATAWRAGES